MHLNEYILHYSSTDNNAPPPPPPFTSKIPEYNKTRGQMAGQYLQGVCRLSFHQEERLPLFKFITFGAQMQGHTPFLISSKRGIYIELDCTNTVLHRFTC